MRIQLGLFLTAMPRGIWSQGLGGPASGEPAKARPADAYLDLGEPISGGPKKNSYTWIEYQTGVIDLGIPAVREELVLRTGDRSINPNLVKDHSPPTPSGEPEKASQEEHCSTGANGVDYIRELHPFKPTEVIRTQRRTVSQAEDEEPKGPPQRVLFRETIPQPHSRKPSLQTDENENENTLIPNEGVKLKGATIELPPHEDVATNEGRMHNYIYLLCIAFVGLLGTSITFTALQGLFRSGRPSQDKDQAEVGDEEEGKRIDKAFLDRHQLSPEDLYTMMGYHHYAVECKQRHVGKTNRQPISPDLSARRFCVRESPSPNSREGGPQADSNQSIIEEGFTAAFMEDLVEPPVSLDAARYPVTSTGVNPVLCAAGCGKPVWGDTRGLSGYCSRSCQQTHTALHGSGPTIPVHPPATPHPRHHLCAME